MKKYFIIFNRLHTILPISTFQEPLGACFILWNSAPVHHLTGLTWRVPDKMNNNWVTMRKGAAKGCKRRVQIYKCSANMGLDILKIWSLIIISTHNVYLKCYLIFYFCFCLWHLPLTRNHLRPWNWSQVVVTLSVHTIYTITIHKVFFLKPNMHAVSMIIV